MIEENGEQKEVPAVYHLTIKAVTGSGRHVISSSDGLYVDDTAPVFDYLYHLDLDYSEDEPTEYQGGNTTLAVRWSAYDLGSQLKEFRWAIGTQPKATDVQEMTSVGLDTFATKHNPNGFLQDRHTYYVTVEAINHAGLTTTQTTTGITVLTTPPDTSHSNTTVQCANRQEIAGESICRDQTSTGVSWTRVEDASVDSYYFQIGSSEDSDDIFPRFRVGYNTSGTVVLKDGQVFIGDESFVNISGVRQIAEGQSGNAGNGELVYRDRFHIEPGRILYSVMTVCNKGHKCEKMTASESLIKRNEDIIAFPGNDSKVVMSLNDAIGINGVHQHTSVKIEANVANRLRKRGADKKDEGRVMLMGGLLSGDDLKEEYVSDASPKFKPYIVNPETTKDLTDRHLRNRIRDIIGPSFYVTSVGDDGLSGPLHITVPFNTSQFNNTLVERYPVIAYWHAETSEWQDASRTCSDSFGSYDTDWNEGLISVKVCSTGESDNKANRLKRETSNSFTGPTEFTSASIGSYTNTPPYITSRNDIYMDEDGGTLHFEIKAFDDDGDDIIFGKDESSPSPLHGTATISVDGKLQYRPCLDWFGVDSIYYTATEDREDDGNILSTGEVLVIDVRPINDNPSIFMSVDHANALHDNEYDLVVALEERRTNETDKAFEAIAGALDPDTFDTLTLTFKPPEHGEFFTGEQHNKVTFIHRDCSRQENITRDHLSYESPNSPVIVFPCRLSIPHEESRLAWVFSAIRYLPDEGYFGEDTIEINAIDEDGYRSKVLVVHLHILANPCSNGAVCVGPPSDPDCSALQRCKGFHGYECRCQPGYVGDYCEIDYDECQDNPCDNNYTCTDLLDAFTCHCESLDWPCAIEDSGSFPVVVVATVLAVGVALFAIVAVIAKRILCVKKKSVKVGPDGNDNQEWYAFTTVLSKSDLESRDSKGGRDHVERAKNNSEELVLQDLFDADDDKEEAFEEAEAAFEDGVKKIDEAQADNDGFNGEEMTLSAHQKTGFSEVPRPKYAWGESKVTSSFFGSKVTTQGTEEESQA
ncbi:uncharacterized protein [Ptychodera flava]